MRFTRLKCLHHLLRWCLSPARRRRNRRTVVRAMCTRGRRRRPPLRWSETAVGTGRWVDGAFRRRCRQSASRRRSRCSSVPGRAPSPRRCRQFGTSMREVLLRLFQKTSPAKKYTVISPLWSLIMCVCDLLHTELQKGTVCVLCRFF